MRLENCETLDDTVKETWERVLQEIGTCDIRQNTGREKEVLQKKHCSRLDLTNAQFHEFGTLRGTDTKTPERVKHDIQQNIGKEELWHRIFRPLSDLTNV